MPPKSSRALLLMVSVRRQKKKLGINDYLGFALGCVGLSFDDFCRCTVQEFESICKAYHDQREAEYKERWEQTRAVVVASLRPHLKGHPPVRKIFPLPWDNEMVKEVRSKAMPSLTSEESKARFERLVERISIRDVL